MDIPLFLLSSPNMLTLGMNFFSDRWYTALARTQQEIYFQNVSIVACSFVAEETCLQHLS
jgi:hypothetical protein